MGKAQKVAAGEGQIEYWDDPANEEHMQDEHVPSWRAMIRAMEENDLSDSVVLDFGCNQGGFLRFLYGEKPYKKGLGVDIARESVKVADKLKGNLPVAYDTNDVLPLMEGLFDIAFSHEVVYLLPNLADHAREIHRVLKPGGVYYLAIGAYADNPLWERWRGVVASFSPVKPQDYTLQDIALAFQRNGFGVSVGRMPAEGFFNYNAEDDRYLKSPAELVDFMTNRMMLFRMTKMEK